MLVPQAGGGEDQVAPAHRAFFAVDRGVSALAFNDHAHRVGGVAVRGCPLAGQQQLHAQIDGGAGLHFVQTVARVGQHQNAALGFFNGGEFARLQQQGFDVFVSPVGGAGVGPRLGGRQNAAQARPQGHQIVRGQGLHVFGGQIGQAAEVVHGVHAVLLVCQWAAKQLATFQP